LRPNVFRVLNRVAFPVIVEIHVDVPPLPSPALDLGDVLIKLVMAVVAVSGLPVVSTYIHEVGFRYGFWDRDVAPLCDAQRYAKSVQHPIHVPCQPALIAHLENCSRPLAMLASAQGREECF
jgi:hypothetical protein